MNTTHTPSTDGSKQSAANAALFAAAPDMLAALQRINEWCCYANEENIGAQALALQQIGVSARAAIARAEGQS